ncbi:M15 family metallopeptidase [Rothia nasimurium]|uniref:M15 family metallopeptidase n=1 Tax=Rothia nasimurium TaxID=85336 RepID=UPI002DD63800|nr:M15 family metallopeptidase [Rothia nasimurium]
MRSYLSHFSLALAGSLMALSLAACGQGISAEPDAAPLPTSSVAASTPQQVASSSAPPSSSASAESAAPSQAATRRPADIESASSMTVLVNKHNPLSPLTYAPDDLQPLGSVLLRAEAAEAAHRMFAHASAAGAPMVALSGYRSYETQQGTYASWAAQYGTDQADVASARPGYSEHQTGLALDIGTGGACDLQPCFKDTAAALWAAENAHRYGFVVRYPWWHHETTGYWYESWHLRYIGVDEATALKESGFETLEDFWGTGPAPSYRNGFQP